MDKTNKSNTSLINYETGVRYLKSKTVYIGLIPFLAYTSIFLLYPTWSVITGAFKNPSGFFDTSKISEILESPAAKNAFLNSLGISFKTSISGSILGALFAWALVTGKRNGFFYKVSIALSSVLAQFGGVMLTFAFLATFGFNGLATTFFARLSPNSFLAQPTWLYGINGLTVVYTFFQIPLMVLVFLPTLENLRPQWRETSNSLGGSTVEFWLRIGIPILTPSFVGAMLLLFVNSFSAYATAATLVNLSDLLTTLQIAASLSSEVGEANPQTAKALSLAMVLVVILSMSLYALIRRKVSRWESTK